MVWWVRGIFVGNDVKLDETLFISLIVSGVFLVIPAFDYYPTFPGTLVTSAGLYNVSCSFCFRDDKNFVETFGGQSSDSRVWKVGNIAADTLHISSYYPSN